MHVTIKAIGGVTVTCSDGMPTAGGLLMGLSIRDPWDVATLTLPL